MQSINRELGKLSTRIYRHHELPGYIRAPVGCYYFPVCDSNDPDFYVGVNSFSDELLYARGIKGDLDRGGFYY